MLFIKDIDFSRVDLCLHFVFIFVFLDSCMHYMWGLSPVSILTLSHELYMFVSVFLTLSHELYVFVRVFE